MKKQFNFLLISLLVLFGASFVLAVVDDSMPCKWGGSVQINEEEDTNGSLIIPYDSLDYSVVENYQNPAGDTEPDLGEYVINVFEESGASIFFMINNLVADQDPSAWAQGNVTLLDLTFTDADEDGYAVGYEGYEGTYSDCDDENNEVYPGATEIFDEIDNNCVDGIDEGIEGSVDDISGNIENLTLEINDSVGVGLVTFKDSTGAVILEFNFDFGVEALDLSKVNITLSSDGYSISVNGIDLTAQGLTKTIYLNTDATKNRLCVLDIAEVNISQITTDCTGANEKVVVCDGVLDSNGYKCTSVDNSTRYKLEGLHHSGIGQYLYTAPVVAATSSGGGGGGGGSRGIVTTPTTTPTTEVINLNAPLTTDTDSNTEEETESTNEETSTDAQGNPGITGAVIGYLSSTGGIIVIAFMGIIGIAAWFIMRKRKVE